MLTGEDLVARLNDQFVWLVAEPLAGMVRSRRSLLQDRVGRDHLARNQILVDAEVLERALRPSPPQLIRGNFNYAKAIGFFPCRGHVTLLDSCLHSKAACLIVLTPRPRDRPESTALRPRADAAPRRWSGARRRHAVPGDRWRWRCAPRRP